MEENDCQCHNTHHHHHHAPLKQLLAGLLAAILIAAAFLVVHPAGIQLPVVDSLSLASLFGFGFLAATTHCIVLTGAILLAAMNWYQAQKTPRWQILTIFHVSRLVAFALVGALLGSLSQFLWSESTIVGAILGLLAAAVMIIMALDFLGIYCWHHAFEHYFSSWQTHWHASRFWWALIAAATLLIPCGFTATVEMLALTSESALDGALYMSAFCLGTVIPLTLVGLSGGLSRGEAAWNKFAKIVIGWLIILWALVGINENLEVLGAPHLELLEHEHTELVN